MKYIPNFKVPSHKDIVITQLAHSCREQFQKICQTINEQDLMARTPWVDVRNYSTFSNAIDDIGSRSATLLVSEVMIISSDETVPANVTLRITQGGSLDIASSKTLTINGFIEAGHYQIFAGTGTYAINSGQPVSPCWFSGADIGDKHNEAVKSLPSTGGRVIYPHYLASSSFATEMLVRSYIDVDFNYCQMTFTATGNAIATAKEDMSAKNTQADGEPCQDLRMSNLNLKASAACADVVALLGIRRGFFSNWRIEKTATSAQSGAALVLVQSGNSGGSGGCGSAQDCGFHNLMLIGGDGTSNWYIDGGLYLDSTYNAATGVNSNFFSNVTVNFTDDYGIKVEKGNYGGVNNVFLHPKFQKIGSADSSAGTGFYEKGYATVIISIYGENLLYGIDRDNNSDNLIVMEGYFPGTVATKFNNMDNAKVLLLTLGQQAGMPFHIPNSITYPVYVNKNLRVGNLMEIADGVTAPSAETGWAKIYVDIADGDLKVKFGDGTVKTLTTD